MVIRDATPNDLPDLLAMGAKFHAVSGLPIPFDPPTFAAVLGEATRARRVIVLADGRAVGMIGMVVNPVYYNANYLSGAEIFWWIEPEHRGRGGKMIDALERRAKQQGVAVQHLSCLATMKEVGRLYERKGYKLMDHNYMKVL